MYTLGPCNITLKFHSIIIKSCQLGDILCYHAFVVHPGREPFNVTVLSFVGLGQTENTLLQLSALQVFSVFPCHEVFNLRHPAELAGSAILGWCCLNLHII